MEKNKLKEIKEIDECDELINDIDDKINLIDKDINQSRIDFVNFMELAWKDMTNEKFLINETDELLDIYKKVYEKHLFLNKKIDE
jgi:hypothetical protein